MDRAKNPLLPANLPPSPSKKSVMEATNSWIDSSSSLSDTTTSKGHKVSKSMNTGTVHDERQNSWVQRDHESEHVNSWAQETQGLGLTHASRSVAQTGPQKPYKMHMKTRSVTDPALSAPTTETRGSAAETMAKKHFGNQISSDRNDSQDTATSMNSRSTELAKVGVLGDKASRVLGEQHVITDNDRTLLQLPKFGRQKPEAIIFSGSMSPTKSGTYGTMGKAQLQDGDRFARVKSHQGLVTTVEDEEMVEEEDRGGLEYLSPAVYSPSVYGGVWEKHPSVGRTVPPFSPAQAYGAKTYRQLLNHPVGPELTKSDRNSPRPSSFHESAEVLPLFAKDSSINAIQVTNNAAPAPRSALDALSISTEAKIEQMEARLHHHIDSCFERLSRTTTDKVDKVVDTVMSKWEALEEQVAKESSRTQIAGMTNQFETLEQGLGTNAAHVQEVRRSLQAIHRTLGRLEGQIAQYACKCEHHDIDPNPEEHDRITFFDGRRHFTVDSRGNQVPAPETNQQNLGTYGSAAGNRSYRQHGGSYTAGTAANDQTDNYGAVIVNREEEDIAPQTGSQIEVPSEVAQPQIDENGNLILANQGPTQATYDVPSFMRIDDDGNLLVNIEEDEVVTQGDEIENSVLDDQDMMDNSFDASVGVQEDEMASSQIGEVDQIAIADDDEGNPILGIQGPGIVVYDAPSFMRITPAGPILVGIADTGSTSATAGFPQIDENGNLVSAVEGQVSYDLPSFMRINSDGQMVIHLSDEELNQEANGATSDETNGNLPFMPIHTNDETASRAESQHEDDTEVVVPQIDVTAIAQLLAPPPIQTVLPTNQTPMQQDVHQGAVPRVDPDGLLNWVLQGPGNVVYDIPSFMRIDNHGRLIIDLDNSANDHAGVPAAQSDGSTNDNGSTLADGQPIAQDGNTTATAAQASPSAPVGERIPTMIMYIDENGEPVYGIEGPNGMWYELPSFMKVNQDGSAEIIEEEDPMTENPVHPLQPQTTPMSA